MSSEHVEVLWAMLRKCVNERLARKSADREAAALAAAIEALKSAPQSGDWVLVPREASSEMLTAAIDAHLGFEGEDEVDAVWAAMISAAEQFGATAGHAVQDVGDGAEGGSRAPTRPTHFSGMFPRQDDPASSSLSHQAVDVGQFRPAVATHQLACRKRVRDCREGLLPTDNLPIYLKELAEANRLLDVVDRAAPQPPAEEQPFCRECGTRSTRHNPITVDLCARCAQRGTTPAPIGWVFQHDETGRMTFCENDGINTPDVFARLNPRHILCGPAFTAPPSAPVGVEDSFSAADMADASAQGFRDGVASVGVVGVEAIAAEIRASLGRGATVSTRRRWAVELEALAQQPAAVDEAMVERAARAWCDNTTHPFDELPEAGKAQCLEDMRAALTAALAAQPGGSDNE